VIGKIWAETTWEFGPEIGICSERRLPTLEELFKELASLNVPTASTALQVKRQIYQCSISWSGKKAWGSTMKSGNSPVSTAGKPLSYTSRKGVLGIINAVGSRAIACNQGVMLDWSACRT
jgi:hypothetical protein